MYQPNPFSLFLSQEPVAPTNQTREQSKSRSRSRTPTPITRQEPSRWSRRYSSDNDTPRHDESVSYSANPVAGDVMFMPIEPRSQTTEPVPVRSPSPVAQRTPTPPREPSPVPGPSRLVSDYQFASSIRPPEHLSATAKSSWGEADQDFQQRTAPANPLRMSMSDRLAGIVDDGYSGRPTEFDRVDAYPHKESTDLGRSRKDEEENVYAVSLRHSSKRPKSPPNDIPITPRNSQIRKSDPVADYTMDIGNDGRPETPPFDAYDLSPRPSFKNNQQIENTNVPSPQKETNFVPKAAFTNQVLMELRSRQRPDFQDDTSSRSEHAVNFSNEDQIIPRSEPNSNRASLNVQQPPPPPPGGIPAPPPPPPLPGGK